MAPSRCRVVEALENLSEAELFAVLKEATRFPEKKTARMLVESVSEIDASRQDMAFGSRGITGRKAEELFIAFHGDTGRPTSGRLKDRRFDGCGYDFEIVSQRKTIVVEVKGLAGLTGRISLTDKEWRTAQYMCDSYCLVIVRNVLVKPAFSTVQNPVAYLAPRLRTYTTLNLSYSVSEQCLSSVERDITEIETSSNH